MSALELTTTALVLQHDIASEKPTDHSISGIHQKKPYHTQTKIKLLLIGKLLAKASKLKKNTKQRSTIKRALV